MIPWHMRPFDEKSREMDYELRGLWILLLAGFILYALPWLAFSDAILEKFAAECSVCAARAGCLVPAGTIAFFIAIQAAVVVLVFKIGRRAREFMGHYYRTKGKRNGKRKK